MSIGFTLLHKATVIFVLFKMTPLELLSIFVGRGLQTGCVDCVQS